MTPPDFSNSKSAGVAETKFILSIVDSNSSKNSGRLSRADGSRKPCSTKDLFTGPIAGIHAAQLGHRLMRFVDYNKKIFRERSRLGSPVSPPVPARSYDGNNSQCRCSIRFLSSFPDHIWSAIRVAAPPAVFLRPQIVAACSSSSTPIDTTACSSFGSSSQNAGPDRWPLFAFPR